MIIEPSRSFQNRLIASSTSLIDRIASDSFLTGTGQLDIVIVCHHGGNWSTIESNNGSIERVHIHVQQHHIDRTLESW